MPKKKNHHRKLKYYFLRFGVFSALNFSCFAYAGSVNAETVYGYVSGKAPYAKIPVEFINHNGKVVAKTVTAENGYYAVNIPYTKKPTLIAVKINRLGDYLYSVYEPSLYGLNSHTEVNVTAFTTTLVYSLSGDHASLTNTAKSLFDDNENLNNNISVINQELNKLFGTYSFNGYGILDDYGALYKTPENYMDVPLYRDCLDYNYMVNISNDTMLKLEVSHGKVIGYSKSISPITNVDKYTSAKTSNAENGIQSAISNTPSGGLVYIPSGTYHLSGYSSQIFKEASFPDGQPIRSALTVTQPDITIVGSQTGKTILKLGAGQHARLFTSGPKANNVTLFNLSFDGNKSKEYTGQEYPDGNVVDFLVGSDKTIGFHAQFTSLYNSLEDGYGLSGSSYIIDSDMYDNGDDVSYGMGITLYGVNGAIIGNDRSSNNKGAGIWLNFGSSNIEINKDTFANDYDGGINITPLQGQNTLQYMMHNIYINDDNFENDNQHGYSSIYMVNAKKVFIYNPNYLGVKKLEIGGKNNSYKSMKFLNNPNLKK